MTLISRVLLTFLAILLVSHPASGHHSRAGYNTSENISLQGHIAKVKWVNPHVFITIQVVDEANGVVAWEIEGPPPAMLRRGGWARETLRVGDTITASGNPAKSASHLLYATNIQPAEGEVFDQNKGISMLMDGGSAPESGANSLEGTWVTLLSPKQLAIYNGKGTAEGLTDAGLAALERFDEVSMNPGVNCVHNPAPASMVAPDLKRISLGASTILIESNFDGASRIVHLENTSPVEVEATNQGFTVGRWEGTTLVMDTTHFSDHAMGNKWGVPSGSQKRLRERLTLSPDGKSITYSYELSDPEYLTDVIAGEALWIYRPDMEFETFECDLETSRRFLQR